MKKNKHTKRVVAMKLSPAERGKNSFATNVTAMERKDRVITVEVPPEELTERVVSMEISPDERRGNVVGSEVVSEFDVAASSKKSVAKTQAEENVVECYRILEIAELGFEPGRQFGLAVVALRDEIKRNGGRNFMMRLKELDIPYGKARYWMAVVEDRPINRGKAKVEVKGDNSSVTPSSRIADASLNSQDDWTEAIARFREISSIIIMLEQTQPEGCEAFIGELEILVESLGYEMKPKERQIKNGLLQRKQPTGGLLVEGTHRGRAHSLGSSR